MEHSFNKQPMALFNHTLHKKKEGVKTHQGSTSLEQNKIQLGKAGVALEIKHRNKLTLEKERLKKNKLGVWG